ncbi:hypothetical protein [Nitrosospira sp. NRS527]|uniref:hypothetical protein n=1 Tax=Nitrosospira sp. NRS527 TaxID=155925 RepID=UPI001AF800EA|nr:hypothetical protein [Nitrosospira sp. NRS527]BCT66852.1 hypothetical protein NNRS527_00420 [Nitrosospira sp. NRS527]
MIKISALIEKVRFLKIPPEAWDALIPHGPRLSRPLIEFMAAGVVRDISGLIRDRQIGIKVKAIGKEMASNASKGLVQGWDDGDDICPPWGRWPFPPIPWPQWGSVTNVAAIHPEPKGPTPQPADPSPAPWDLDLWNDPSPLPWLPGSVEQFVLAKLLISLAGITTDPEFGMQLKNEASSIVKMEVNNLAESFGSVKKY